MGSFNQICLLTRTPITYGDKVVVWKQIDGPWFRRRNEGLEDGLLFGLPQRALYDDYGGAEKYENEALENLHERAWAAQTLYRAHPVTGSHNESTLFIASSAQTMSRTHDLAPLFYGMEELNPLDVFDDVYEEAFTQKKSRATERASNALKNIGERLGKADLPEDKAQCLAACFHVVQEEVGPALAWAVWEILSKGEMFARERLCMMRAEAYDSAIGMIGNSMVSKYGVKNSSMTYRESLVQRWDAWEAKRRGMVGSKTNSLILGLRLRDDTLMPMGQPWEVEERPIEAFFWNTIDYDTLVAEVGKDLFLDAMIFSTVSSYMRVPMVAQSGGGQHSDWKLHAHIMNSVYRHVRKEDGRLRRDWFGSY